MCPICGGSGRPPLDEFGWPVTSGTRAIVWSVEDRLEIEIPAPRISYYLLLPFASLSLLVGVAKSGSTVAWIFWTFSTLFVVGLFAWMFSGQERIVLNRSGLSIRYELGRLHREKRFALGGIHNVRVSNIVMESRSIMPPGKIAFDHDGKTYRFGSGIDEAEANDLIRKLKERLPSV